MLTGSSGIRVLENRSKPHQTTLSSLAYFRCTNYVQNSNGEGSNEDIDIRIQPPNERSQESGAAWNLHQNLFREDDKIQKLFYDYIYNKIKVH